MARGGRALRRAFAGAAPVRRPSGHGGSALVLGTKTLRLNPEVLTTDVAEFEAALAEGRPADGLALYHGPLADGFHLPGAPGFEDWLATARARLARAAIDAARALAEAAAGAGDWAEAARWCHRLAGLDPWSEAHALALARALAMVGDRVGAVRVLEGFGERLARELELPPGPGVLEALGRLRDGRRSP